MMMLGVASMVALVFVNGAFVATQVGIRELRGDAPTAPFDPLYNGAQLGVTLCSLGLGVLAEPVLAAALGRDGATVWSVALALATTVLALMVVGELVPSSVASVRPAATVAALGTPLRLFVVVATPLRWCSQWLADQVLRWSGVRPAGAGGAARTRAELRHLVRHSQRQGSISHADAELLERTLRLADKTAADALTPRVEMASLHERALVGDLVALSSSTGLSRFPVYRADLDDIVGVVHIKDVLGLPAAGRSMVPVLELVRPVLAVPESKELEALMIELQAQAGQFAVVVDEYGGTAGIITLEDLIEEIVGEIDDEHDPARSGPPVRRWAGAHVVSGRLHPDELFDACGLQLPPGDFDTLGGFVMSELGRIPAVGDGFEHQGWDVSVAAMDGHRVATVRLVQQLDRLLAADDAT